MDDGFGRKLSNVLVKRRGLLLGATALLLGLSAGLSVSTTAKAEPLRLEKEQLKLGFIKLTDMAPLAIAYEKGFFEDEGLFVTLEAQANWKVLLDRVITGQLDGAHMLAGQPVHPIPASALKPVVAAYKADGKSFNMGMVFPVSTHNYYLRYWLAAGGLNPGLYSVGDTSGKIGADVLLSVTPPPQMPATLEAGTIDGYCVGEPWNQAAVFKGIGVPVITDTEIWKNNPEKVFGITAEFAEKNPNTVIALTKALIRAAEWLDADNGANRAEAVRILSKPNYVGADAAVIANSMTGTFEYEKGDKRDIPDFNVFFRYNATYPFYSDAVWFLTQMRRWGQIDTSKPDAWYADTAKSVYRPDIYLKAARALVDEGKAKSDDFPWTSDGYKVPTADFIDGIAYDGHAPNSYIDALPLGLKGKEQVVGTKIVAK